MKKRLLTKMWLLGLMLVRTVSQAEAASSVTTDGYGKTKVVWDFGIQAKDGNATYYLDAATSAYVESTAYPSAANQRSKFLVAQINVHSSRSIKSNDNPDSDKGSGVILGNGQGYITIYAPVSGTLSLTGKYLSNITVIDKSASDTKLTTNGSSVKVKQGHRIQLTASSGCGVATMTLTPDDYDTDVVASGDWNFANTEVIRPSYDITGTNMISTTGYKTAEKTSKDVFVVAANSGGSVRIHPNEEAAGLKLGSGAEFDFTPTNAGYLTITYSYGGTRGSWYIKEGSTNKSFIGTRSDKTVVVYLAAGYRAQFVCGTGSNTSVLITNVTFTEGSPVKATIGTNGYTTFCTGTYPLDLSALPTGTKAYTASLTGKTLSFNACTQKVPVGTGLLIAGTPNEEVELPVAQSGTAVADNALKAATTATSLTSTADTYYFGMKATDTDLVFAFLAIGTEYTIPAGKAYVEVPATAFTGGESRALTVSFEDEATGISDVSRLNVEGKVYDLRGRRLDSSSLQKGLYIINGKKVIIK